MHVWRTSNEIFLLLINRGIIDHLIEHRQFGSLQTYDVAAHHILEGLLYFFSFRYRHHRKVTLASTVLGSTADLLLLFVPFPVIRSDLLCHLMNVSDGGIKKNRKYHPPWWVDCQTQHHNCTPIWRKIMKHMSISQDKTLTKVDW